MKKILCMVMSLIMVFALCACGADDNTPTTDGNNSVSGTEGNNGTVPPLYENEDKGITAIYHYETDALVSGIEKSLTKFNHMKTNGKYCDGWGNELELASEPVKFFNVGERMAYWAADGKFYVHTANEYIAFDVPNDDSLVGYHRYEHGGYYFYNLKDGYLHLSMYDDEDGSARESTQNVRLYFCMDTEEISEQKITAYLFDGHHIVLWLEDGNCYYFSGHSVGNDTYDGERVTVIFVKKHLENVDQVYDCVSFDGDRNIPVSPIYSKTGDNANLYFMYDNASEEYELKITLPEGFTTADLKQVHFEEHLFVEFNDGSVYVLDEENIKATTANATVLAFTCHEGLSELGRAGHILAILNYDLGSRAVVLLDDGCLYRVDAR